MKAAVDPVIEALKGYFPNPQAPLVVAYSGGLDSTVLLHAAVARWGPTCVVAAHVDHQLQSASSEWLAHCRAQVHVLGVRFESCTLKPGPSCVGAGEPSGAMIEGSHEATGGRESLRLGEPANTEAWARQARYDALTRIARECHATALATAHHADDQLETLLMALARGAGLDGLTGIAAQTQRGGVTLIRPLLQLPRSTLRAWAQQRQLQWIEDPMNEWPQLQRTAIRKRLTPLIDEVLPGLRRHLPQALESLRESREALDEASQLALKALRVAPQALHALDRKALAALPEARQRRVLRAWIASLGLAMPTRARLQAIQSQCLVAASSHADLRHEGWHLVRQGPRLLAWPEERHPQWQVPVEPLWLSGWCDRGLALPDGSWLKATRGHSPGLLPDWLRSASFSLIRPGATMRVRLREGGPSREIRKLWQEVGLPVSVRESCALILANDTPFWLVPFGQLAGPWPCALGGLTLVWDTMPGDPRAIGA